MKTFPQSSNDLLFMGEDSAEKPFSALLEDYTLLDLEPREKFGFDPLD